MKSLDEQIRITGVDEGTGVYLQALPKHIHMSVYINGAMVSVTWSAEQAREIATTLYALANKASPYQPPLEESVREYYASKGSGAFTGD